MLHPVQDLLHTSLSNAHMDPDIQTFHILLDVDSKVDEIKLRRAAGSGIPFQIRPYVWKLLLGIAAFEKVHDVTLERNRFNDYYSRLHTIDIDGDISTRIRKLLKRSKAAYLPQSMYNQKSLKQGSTSGESNDDDLEEDLKQDNNRNINSSSTTNTKANLQRRTSRIITTEITSKFARVITSYLKTNANNIEFSDDMVYLCAPFIELMSNEADAYYAFNALMQKYQYMFTEDGLHEAISEFIHMFRTLHPNLYDHFISEEVDINSWVKNWLRSLLVLQLPRNCLLRLWDSYFANFEQDGLTLHPFVCLVFIEHLKSELQDCDDAERIVGILTKLPTIDIDRIIAHAHTTKQELTARGIL